MSDAYQFLNVVAFIGTFVVHLYYLVVGLRWKKWKFVAMLGGIFVIWFIVTFIWIGFGIGYCAAGCPDEPFSFFYASFYYGLSIGYMFWLRKFSENFKPNGGIPH